MEICFLFEKQEMVIFIKTKSKIKINKDTFIKQIFSVEMDLEKHFFKNTLLKGRIQYLGVLEKA